ncbi:MAG: alpha/beta hydrolase, partial [Thermodesulfobacteriota bacterium]|nr:alpha/beta hydrolase [Thermodesulfobacteriota bacterium]
MRKNGKDLLKTAIFFIACLAVLLGAEVIAWMTQRDFGNVRVTNVTYENYNGIPIRAKLMRPVDATDKNTVPGIVYIHGYQNNRETSDAYCIELARRGFAVLNIDAIGRGNSGIPGDPKNPFFDCTYGARSSFEYLKNLPFVNTGSLGMMGHSLGAEMAYRVALDNPSVKALVISGFAYGTDATENTPKNMLMIFGKWDEYRERMTRTDDFEREWMHTPQTKKAIPVDNPRLGVTYGDFASGTARRVFMPRGIHIQESHSREPIAEAVVWMRNALHPKDRYWKDAQIQIWPIKEWATLVAMIACFASLLPL